MQHHAPRATHYYTYGDISMPNEYDEHGDLHCGYASKKCGNARTTKKGGGLHRFCAFHRERANRNQWRVDNKRRAVRAQRRQLLKRIALSINGNVNTTTGVAAAAVPSLEPLRGPVQSLTSEDIELLQVWLFDTKEDEDRGARRAGSDSEASMVAMTASLDCTAIEMIF